MAVLFIHSFLGTICNTFYDKCSFNNNYCHTVYLSFIDDHDDIYYVYFMFDCLLQLISE